MKNLLNIEVFHIETTDEGTFAYISYQDPNWKGDDPTNGFNHIKVPLKLRPIQLSIRGNTLVDQSEKDYDSVSAS
jgi:hypothetical protein